MVPHHLSIFAAAFLGAISASLISLVVPPADPAVGLRAPVSTPAKPMTPVPPAPVRDPSSSMDMDGPIDDCAADDICDPFDDNDPIPV